MSMRVKPPLHATALALGLDADGPLCGILLLGASGAGKSLLALGAIDQCPWHRSRLIADDAVCLGMTAGRLWAEAPAPLKNLIEVRGYGPTRLMGSRLHPGLHPGLHSGRHPVRLAFDLDASPARLPDAKSLADYAWPVNAHPHPLAGAGNTGGALAAVLAGVPLFPFLADAPFAGARLRAVARAVVSGQPDPEA